jgi:hypothetical protein
LLPLATSKGAVGETEPHILYAILWSHYVTLRVECMKNIAPRTWYRACVQKMESNRKVLLQGNGPIRHVETCLDFFFHCKSTHNKIHCQNSSC